MWLYTSFLQNSGGTLPNGLAELMGSGGGGDDEDDEGKDHMFCFVLLVDG